MNLVTGSTGIVGIHIMIELLRRGEEVRAMCRKNSDRETVTKVFDFYGEAELLKKIEWVEADILNRDDVDAAAKNVDVIYHSAAMVSFCKRDHATMWATNVDGTATLVEAAIRNGVSAMCHVSSIGALGKGINGAIVTEDMPWQTDDNHSVYSQSKFRQEMEVWRGPENGLNVVVVNPGVVLGPGRIDRSSGQIVKTIRRGTAYYTDGATGYVDARDLAHAMIELTENKHFGQRFIVVADNCEARHIQTLFANALGVRPPHKHASHKMLELAALAAKTASFFTRKRPALTFESVRAIGGHQKYSSEKLKSTINLNFRTIEDSIQNMTAYFKTTERQK